MSCDNVLSVKVVVDLKNTLTCHVTVDCIKRCNVGVLIALIHKEVNTFSKATPERSK